jgi:hypothetical protein
MIYSISQYVQITYLDWRYWITVLFQIGFYPVGRRERDMECNIGTSAKYCAISGMCGLQIKDRIPKEDTMDDWKTNIDGMNLSGKSERGEYASDY